jgi:hypothetical protein
MMRVIVGIVTAAVVTVGAGCGGSAQCSASTCSGCCQADGFCGTCGSGGGSGGNTGSCNVNNCPGCCFNGTCQNGSAGSACGKNGAFCVACGNNQVCKSDQTCGVDGQLMFKVQPVSATITMKDPTTGQDWDSFASPPDPYVLLQCPAGGTLSTVPEVADTYMPTWSTGGCTMSATALLNQGFDISVYDGDGVGDDPISSKSTVKATEANFVDGAIITSGGGVQTMRIELQRDRSATAG